MIFDTHAHYDDEQFDMDRDALLSGIRDHNVGTIVNVGASPAGCRASVELAGQYDFVYAAVGLHPDEVGALDEGFLNWMRQTAETNPKVVAIGEIGLDYHWDVEPREVQQDCFVRQMELARAVGLPILVHSREAAQDTFDLIAAHGHGLDGIIHCYAYSPEMAMEYVKLGYHIGLGGVVTFKNARKAKETAAAVPLEHIVLETDCPYMAPTPFRGKRNSSDLIIYVAEEIARLKGISPEEVIATTEANAKRIFHLS
ncbi:MAG: TatD family hydrolase [Lachnospiraceae bacterium]|nr:TatD family hydrolase [Lachnospiraceae bacterium]